MSNLFKLILDENKLLKIKFNKKNTEYIKNFYRNSFYQSSFGQYQKKYSKEEVISILARDKIYEYFIGRDATAISELGAYFTDRHITNYIYEKLLKPTLDDNGNVRTTVSDTGVGQFREEFDFKKFPFDTQKLLITISRMKSSEANPDLTYDKTSAVNFITPNIGPFIGLDNFKNNNILKEWTVLSSNIMSKEIINKNYYDPYLDKIFTKSRNGIDLILEVKRNSAHYFYKIIIPVFLILCVAWFVLWIPTDKLDARLTTSIVALLSLIAYNFVFADDIPKLDYLTALDKYVLMSYIFCCIPTFMSIGFSRFIVKNQRLVINLNRRLRTWLGLVYILLTIQIFQA